MYFQIVALIFHTHDLHQTGPKRKNVPCRASRDIPLIGTTQLYLALFRCVFIVQNAERRKENNLGRPCAIPQLVVSTPCLAVRLYPYSVLYFNIGPREPNISGPVSLVANSSGARQIGGWVLPFGTGTTLRLPNDRFTPRSNSAWANSYLLRTSGG